MISVRLIVEAVAEAYQVRAADIVSRRRTATILWPRQTAMWLAKELTPLTLEVIGRHLGGRDHTTVGHAIRVVDGIMAGDPVRATEVRQIAEAVRALSDSRNLLTRAIPVDLDPVTIAYRVLANGDAAAGASADEVRALASAVLTTPLPARVADLVATATDFVAARDAAARKAFSADASVERVRCRQADIAFLAAVRALPPIPTQEGDRG